MLNFKKSVSLFLEKAQEKISALPIGWKGFLFLFGFAKYFVFCLIFLHGTLKIAAVSFLLAVLCAVGFKKTENGLRWRFAKYK